jgi:hypothetical protein
MILTVTGVAMVEFSFYGKSEAMDAVHTIQNQYTLESHVNKALWRVNTFADDEVSYQDGNVSVNFDTTTQRLIVGVSQYDQTRAVMADMVEDNHFRHALAASDSLLLNGYTVGAESHRSPKGEFRFLPTLDLQYFLDSAVAVHEEDYFWYDQNDFEDEHGENIEGIHVFTGDDPFLNSVTLHNSTLVFTSEWVHFYKDNDIRAAKDSTNQLPAVVLTHPDVLFSVNREFRRQDNIEGAIWCAGKVRLTRGDLTGPVIANRIEVLRDMDFKDDEHPEYYVWGTGFGEYSSYDWPKVIVNWTEAWVQ